MRVQHNMSAMNGQRQLNITNKSLAKVTEKLSSGYKINRAADNAAGLSISEKMRKQIRGLTRASENAEDGISMIQTADGALAEVTDMIQRMNELCIQAANGTNSGMDRQYIQDEIDQLKTEIDRVAETTKFNELYLLKGDYAGVRSLTSLSDVNSSQSNIHLSFEQIQNLDGIKILYNDIVGDEVDAVTTPYGPSTNYTGAEATLANILKTSIVPQAVSQFVSKFPAAFGYLNNSTIGIGLRLYNDASTTTLAAVQLRYNSAQQGNELGFQLSVNMHALGGDLTLSNTSIRNDLEGTIIHEMMHAFMDEALTYGMTSAADSFPKWFKEGMAQTAVGGCFNGNDWVNGGGNGLHITSSSSLADISNAVRNSSNHLLSDTTPARYGTGYLACMYLGYLINGSGTISADGIRNGLDKMLAEIEGNDTTPPLSLDDIINKYTSYTSLSDFENQFGDTSSSQFIHDLVNTVGEQGTGGVLANFDTSTVLTGMGAQPGLLPDGTLSGITLFQLDTTTEEVKNQYPAGYSVYTGGGRTTVGNPGQAGQPAQPGRPTQPGQSGIGIAAYKRAKGPITLQIGSDSNVKMQIYIDGMSCKDIGLLHVDVTTESRATDSIDVVSEALQQVSTQRARLGAYQNRLEHTIGNLDNIVENTTQAESIMRDTDMAETMVEYSNLNILQQAGQSMLAQSDQLYQGVMTLLAS